MSEEKNKNRKCPEYLSPPDGCEYCKYGQISMEDYEYRCNYDEIKKNE